MSLWESIHDEFDVFDDEIGEFVTIKLSKAEPVYDPRCHQGSFAEFERGGMAGEQQAEPTPSGSVERTEISGDGAQLSNAESSAP